MQNVTNLRGILRVATACIAFGLAGVHAQDSDAYALLIQRANAALDRFDLEIAEARFTEAIAAAESAGIDAREIAEVERKLARVQSTRSRSTDAVATLRRALERLEKAYGTDDAVLVGCLEDLAGQAREQGDATAALELLRRALTLVKDDVEGAQPGAGLDADSVRLRLLDAFVKAALAKGDPSAMLDGAQKRLAILSRTRGPDSADLTVPLKQIAAALRALGREKDAIPSIQEWIRIHEAVRGAHHAGIAEGLEDLVACQVAIGALDDADATIARWSGILKRVAADHPNLVDTGAWAARVLALRGRHAEAADRFEEALTLAKRAYWNRKQRLGELSLAIARECREAGRFERARSSLTEAREYFASLGDASLETLQVRIESARLELALDQPAAAATTLEATIASLEERFGKANRALSEPLDLLARAYRALDRGAEAERVEKRAASIRTADDAQRKSAVGADSPPK